MLRQLYLNWKRIKLRHSTIRRSAMQISNHINFSSHSITFQYFKSNIGDPSHAGKLVNTMWHTKNKEMTEFSHNMFMRSTLSGMSCVDRLYECKVSTQYGKLHLKVLSLQEVLNAIYGYMLSEINHLENHPTLIKTSHKKCNRNLYGHV